MSQMTFDEDHSCTHIPKDGGCRAADILIVEDEPAVADIAAETLRGIGHRIICAHSWLQALNMVKRDAGIDLLFTDVLMPGVHGFKLADMVRTLRPSIKILYATGYMTTARALSEVERVHGPVLFKPYRPSELESAVRDVMNGVRGATNQ